MTFLATRPRLYVFVIRDKNDDFSQLIQILTSVSLFFWYHRHIIMSAVKVLTEIGYIFQAINQAGIEINASFYSLFLHLLIPYWPVTGIG